MTKATIKIDNKYISVIEYLRKKNIKIILNIFSYMDFQ